jgi:hypothetical protein
VTLKILITKIMGFFDMSEMEQVSEKFPVTKKKK